MGAQDQRPRFFEGQYLSADDLTAIIDYQRTGDARHALGAHTWGIALGLNLLEKAAPGAPNRVEVVLQPGFAWDGFGRPLAVARPTRLSESLFAEIPFHTTLDDPITGTGRLMPVWLAYDEIGSRNPAPGFESCATDDQSRRIGEAFRFVIGRQPVSEQRAPVTIGTQSMDAPAALTTFDPTADTLWDTSVPHQTFPGPGKPPRWLMPIGYVRWIARQNALGYFARRDLKTDEHADGQIRAFRRQIGAVAERIEAADGAIVLHDRAEDPNALHRYAKLVGNAEKALGYRSDLVWVEGNLRVGGDAKINGGKLHLRDADGEARNTPLYFARAGDDSPTDDGKRQLRVAIGDSTQKNNKLYVGPEQTVAGVTGIAPRLVVVSGVDGNDGEGRVGINDDTPHAALEVKGDWTDNEDGALRLAGNQPTIRFEGGADVGQHKWIAQLTSQPAGALRLAHRTGIGPWNGVLYATPDLRVGIGATTPRNPLAVHAQQGSPGWEELISLEDVGGTTKWHVNLRAAGGGKHLNIAETGVEDGRLYLQAGGNVGMGTTDPLHSLHVARPGHLNAIFDRTDLNEHLTLVVGSDGSGLRFSETNEFFVSSQPYAGRSDNSFGTKEHIRIKSNGNVGIGTTVPDRQLHIKEATSSSGNGLRIENADNTRNLRLWVGTGGGVVDAYSGANLHLRTEGLDRLFIQNSTGRVGIGTTAPQQELHVNGAFVRVEGRASEQAYIGGDGAGGPDVQIGSFNASVGQVHFWNIGTGSWMQIWGIWHGPSDARLKRNIEPLSNSLGRVRALKGVSYQWRTDSATVEPQRHIGLVAQDVQQVVPEVVVRSGRGDLGIDYQGLVGLLVGAVQELKDEVEGLRAELRKLHGTASRDASRK